jgi:excisionase family DNA binding protein
MAPSLCISLPDAAKRLGVGRTKLHELIDRRLLLTVRIGRYRLIRIDDLEEYERHRAPD